MFLLPFHFCACHACAASAFGGLRWAQAGRIVGCAYARPGEPDLTWSKDGLKLALRKENFYRKETLFPNLVRFDSFCSDRRGRQKVDNTDFLVEVSA
jgi:hypothetical protein